MEPDPPFLFEPTLRKQATSNFHRARTPFRWVGLLTPIGGLAAARIRIERQELILGRDNSAGAVIADASVSRPHARIRRNGDEFTLEDLGSFNGTHVDGVPIRNCVLHDGDTVQLGQTLYYFERVLERDSTTRGESR